MKKKKHTPEEIVAKLRQADEMVAQGKLHSEVAKTLGVSVMTYHRWRKARLGRSPYSRTPEETNVPRLNGAAQAHMTALQVENSRLRRLVTDLLLEKVRLEETLGGKKPGMMG